MLGSVLKILLFFVVLRMLYPFFKSIGALFSSNTPAKKPGKSGEARDDYSDLTSYEIEDADFEEIREDRG